MTATNSLRRPLSAMRALLRSGAGGGLLLMAAAALAIIAANSPAAPTYFAVRGQQLGPLSLLGWVNDGLMAVFFLLVGLEVKRELIDGELSSWERRALPGTAAALGMAVPALLYVVLNRGDAGTIRGWAIPSATDIAFALGVLALAGRRAPASLKVFLTAVAVIDDLGAILIIALFYSAGIDFVALGLAFGGVAALALLNRLGARQLWVYLLPAPAIWFAMHESGVHATIAGVAIALTVPLDASHGAPEAAHSPLHRLEHALAPIVNYAILPLFGFLNAGVALGGIDPAALTHGVTLGVLIGLFVGKQLGVFAALRLFGGRDGRGLPAGASWAQAYGVAILCGIGFTMSLFIGGLAFPGDAELETELKLGVLGGSLLSALAGAAVLARVRHGPSAAAPGSGRAAPRNPG
jgi:NhaA family Na+:H+ antiporter